MVAESLLLNSAVATQLALQQLALAGGCFAVREADFPDDRAARAAYQAFRRDVRHSRSPIPVACPADCTLLGMLAP